MTAGCTKWMVEKAKPTTDADIDRKAVLSRELMERVHIVNKGTEMEHEGKSQLHQTDFYCEEADQRNGNMNEDIPIAYRMPLEGEGTWCASSEVSDLDGDTNALNAAVEHADHPDESTETKDTREVESEGCERDMSEFMSIDEVDGDAGQKVKPMDTPNELTEFVALLIELEDLHSGDISCVHLRGTGLHADHADGPGGGTDVLSCQVDGSRGSMDVLGHASNAKMADISHGHGAGTYLGAGDVSCGIEKTDGLEGHVDASNGLVDVPSVEKNPTNPTNKTENVRAHQIGQKPQYSLNAPENRMSKCPIQWRRVSPGDGDVYIL